MPKETSIKLFESKKIRVHWDNEIKKWYFSVIDITEVLTANEHPREYWSELKRKFKDKGSEVYEKIGQLKKQHDLQNNNMHTSLKYNDCKTELK